MSLESVRYSNVHNYADSKNAIRIANVVANGTLSAEDACIAVDQLMRRSRRTGIKVLKLIHGYDANGAGFRLRQALREYLRRCEQDNRIRRSIPGERWAHFDEQSRELLRCVPESILDADFGHCNKGITLVIL